MGRISPWLILGLMAGLGWGQSTMSVGDLAAQRERMVKEQLVMRGISNARRGLTANEAGLDAVAAGPAVSTLSAGVADSFASLGLTPRVNLFGRNLSRDLSRPVGPNLTKSPRLGG